MRIPLPRRMSVLRFACVTALAASAALTADSWHSDRGFCPLKSACEKARESAFGSVLGVPTSVIGMLAFGSLFLLTFLPPARARKFARPAALGGALVGTGLAVVQALSLHVFCPLCVVADVSALVAGAASVGWAKPKVRRGKKKPPAPEFVGYRLRWALAALLAVVVPTGWPRTSKPAWVEIHTPLEFADANSMAEPDRSSENGDVSQARPATGRPNDTMRRASEGPGYGNLSADAVLAPKATDLDTGTAAGAPRGADPTPARNRDPATEEPLKDKEIRAARISSAARIFVTEYLNPFCSHCRATHARLDRLLAGMDVEVRRRRVYVWSQDEPPLWAKCLSCARGMGLEDRFFDELVRTSGQDRSAIEGAATRAGIDPASLTMCRASAATLEKLQQERDTVMAAGIESLPTFDIGRRRLMGEQSEAELREALTAAGAPAR